jgi:hypothetical protein
MSADDLVEFLYTSGSLLAAEACLDSELPFSMPQFRQFCSAIHEACRAVAAENSHIHLARYGKRLARQWLHFGDLCSSVNVQESVSSQPLPSILVDDEETVNFVMDLADIHEEQDAGNSGESSAKTSSHRYTSEEEPSAIRSTSAREISEAACQRVALRVAFILAFTDEHDAPVPVDDAENKSKTVNSRIAPTSSLRKFLTEATSIDDIKVLELSRYLLRMVFAKFGSTIALHGGAMTVLSADTSPFAEDMEVSTSVTFSMRHRAFRAASVLCPQWALERIAFDEGILRGSTDGDIISLKDYAFGVFVAKEIEEMGLPLPHSDLHQLSSMNFLSYSRTLWRHNRGNEGNRGRLLLLLLEMSLQGGSADPTLLNALLEEMTTTNLPRSVLMASERLIMYEVRTSSSSVPAYAVSLENALDMAITAIMGDAHRALSSGSDTDDISIRDPLQSVARLGKVVTAVGYLRTEQHLLLRFIRVLEELYSAVGTLYERALIPVLTNALRCVSKPPIVVRPLSNCDDSVLAFSSALHSIEAHFAHWD